MTRAEFIGQFNRLCGGFRYAPTDAQSEAWYRRVGMRDLADWAEAVTTLLCGPRFPLLDPVLAALEQAYESRRKVQVTTERHQAGKWMKARHDANSETIEDEYNTLRLGLIRAALTRIGGEASEDRCKRARWREDNDVSTCPDCASHSRKFALKQVEGIANWLAQPDRATWAKTTNQGDCGMHGRSHTVNDCLHDELQYWTLRAEGVEDREAKQRVLRSRAA